MTRALKYCICVRTRYIYLLTSVDHFQMRFAPLPVKCTKSAVLRVSGRVVKSLWTFLVKKNVSRGATVPRAWPSQRITNVCPIHSVPVITMDARTALEL